LECLLFLKKRMHTAGASEQVGFGVWGLGCLLSLWKAARPVDVSL
jgi:hypothetical protein